MPMDRRKYPSDWDAIAARIKAEAEHKCESCGKQCRQPGEPLDSHQRTLTVAHIDHDPSNSDAENLVALCAPCHLRYDNARRRLQQLARKRVTTLNKEAGNAG